jgi:hypothetical protein
LNLRPSPVGALVAVLLLAGASAASAQSSFRCQFDDGHVEFRDGGCPFGAKQLNLSQPQLNAAKKKAPAEAAAGSGPKQEVAIIDASSADALPTRSPVDADFRNIPVRALLERMARLVGKRAEVDPAIKPQDRITCSYHDVPWDEAIADIGRRAGLDIQVGDAAIVAKKR